MIPAALAGALADRYRLEREVGRGGMATVYLAHDVKHGRRVAIKVMDQELAAAIGPDRFLREIEIAARLTHPHILPLFDSGVADGQLYYVMPFIAGESLRSRLSRERQLPLEDALRLTREIASALNHAHHQGLIHRDIKPENVLLADDIALVADFGIARALSGDPSGKAATQRMTAIGSIVGTPPYMAPEQVVGSADMDARADLYSLGCVLYELLAGAPPFQAATPAELFRMHLTATPRDVMQLRPSVPANVAAAVMRALAKLPADRFTNMSQFAEALAVTGGPHPTPALTGGARTATPHNLPRHRTHFIGRQGELAECARLLTDTRLLTLTGVGGSGKTRLATRLAEGMLETFADGVWFIDLAPIEVEPLLAEATVTTLGARAESGQNAVETVINHLRGKCVLIVFDNCEHLLGATAGFVDRLLGALPELRALATSREGLGVEGERLFAVRSLAVPRPEEATDLEALLRSEAVRLFVDRARDVNSEFTVDIANAGLVADICRRLDGIPLAIELAAARTRALSIEQIARMLDDRFRLLTGGSRGALERHRTLRATVQWSYDHLTPEEQAMFAALSVFAGGWSLEAAARVTGRDEFDVLDLLTRLIDKSLVLTERHDGPEARYRMLETLRQFGLDLLVESGQGDTLRSAHLDHFLTELRGMEAELRESFPIAAVKRIEADLDNLRAALNWGFEHDPPRAVELTRRLVRLWFSPEYYEEALRWYAQTIALDSVATPRDRADALARSGRIALQQGRYDEARRFYGEELKIHRAHVNRVGVARTLVRLGMMDTYRGRHEDARAANEEALEIFSEIQDRDGMGRLENAIGNNAYMQGDLAEARRRYESSLAIFRQLRHEERIQVELGNLAYLEIAESNAAAAREHLRECLSLNREHRNLYAIASKLPALAAMFRLEGDGTTAAHVVGSVDALLAKIGASLEPMERQGYDTVVERLRIEMGDEAFQRARRDGLALAWEEAIALVGA